jgi:hypothetical protein
MDWRGVAERMIALRSVVQIPSIRGTERAELPSGHGDALAGSPRIVR